jgi:SAM-dependent methyltransferase
MKKRNFRKAYIRLVHSLKKSLSVEQAMQQAIGGQFEAFGILEREILIQYGLRKDDYVIDVGCGSGRLAKPLSQYLSGKYLGLDLVPSLCDYARQLVRRPDWRFEVTEGLAIPEVDDVADMACFFSVFTHLLHEHSYRYLQEAKRVLKPGGKIIFSFLEFAIPAHWAIFEAMRTRNDESSPLNMFMSRDGIEAWALHLDLHIEAIHDGDKPHIPLPYPIVLENGAVMKDQGNLGQSVCVLVKKSTRS